ncbi:hypothetical protein H8Z72_23420 (plasmid) [Xanthomonas citri pv. citri]|nr:hypothetical protein [Xanthomonas citri]QRD62735.1 hypothetical protein H8Z74_22765 [Xanthomonas citri pv. citri]QRD67062.1 hypothetical protein H8Z73_22850 [Xanthomonas citri pv. citri]QRD71685.1 hypothetical protein H8Z72_23420 [Xanthomonas citri pv. citri]
MNHHHAPDLSSQCDAGNTREELERSTVGDMPDLNDPFREERDWPIEV